MKQLLAAIFLVSVFFACEPREEAISTDSGLSLSFSEDSVLFDTIFTEIRNVTKRFKVYNNNDNALEISYIRLQNASSSPYEIIVNGISGKSFENVYLRGQDSIYVLVNVDLPAPRTENEPFLVDDKIEFLTNGNVQSVHLRSYGQDAIFYKDSLLDCNITWTAEKPIVIIESVGIPEDCKLTIEAGTKIYLDNASSILVFGTLEVNGTFENPVTFSGIRLEGDFENVPGQWGNLAQIGIWFTNSSRDNVIQWAEIKNASTGIRIGDIYASDSSRVYSLDQPKLTLSNSIIKNMTGDGIIKFGGELIATNNLITNCGNNGLGLYLGGSVLLVHNTIASYSFDFRREEESVIVTDFFPSLLGGGPETQPLQLVMRNNIIWGSIEDEWGFNFQEPSTQVDIAYNFIRLNNVDRINSLGGNNNVLLPERDDLMFKDFREFNFELDTLSPAKDIGDPNLILSPDLNNNPRSDGAPDMGAYERLD